MVILLIALFILLLVLFMPVKAVLEVQNRNLYINIILYGVIKIAIKAKTKKVKHKIEEALEEADEKVRKIPGFGVLLEIYQKSKSSMFKFLSSVETKIDLNIKIGLSEPDKTAVAYGLINCLLYSFESVLKNIFRKYSGTYNISPDFKILRFDLDSEITISFKLYKAISFSLKLLLIYFKYKSEFIIKGGENDGRASNRRANENYNG
jgi:hypothetical protein